jgi:ankyrin repeat protein
MLCVFVTTFAANADGDQSLAQYLLDHGAKDSLEDAQGHTPRYYADYKGHEALAKLLA